MPKPTFLKITPNDGFWCISPIAQTMPGHGFLIICTSETQAQLIISQIENDQRNYPTVDVNGYEDVSQHYPLFHNIVRVFRPI